MDTFDDTLYANKADEPDEAERAPPRSLVAALPRYLRAELDRQRARHGHAGGTRTASARC